MLEHNIFLFWAQGWNHAPWLSQRVRESWQRHHPLWTIHLLHEGNLKDYIPTEDTPALYDPRKKMTTQARSDIIRLAVLRRWGGVWADATLLCMQPLDGWVEEAVTAAGLWMYHGHGAGMDRSVGPASWFIVSMAGGELITRWKAACDQYWATYDAAGWYFWMDGLFRELVLMDPVFAEGWARVPYLYCEDEGQSHTLAHHGMEGVCPDLQQRFEEQPPYVLKFWSHWSRLFPDPTTDACRRSNGGWALQMSQRMLTAGT